MYKRGFLCSISLRIHLGDLSGTNGEWAEKRVTGTTGSREED